MMMRGIVLVLLAVVAAANAIPRRSGAQRWKPLQNAPQQNPQETRSLLKSLMDELEDQLKRDNKVADKEVDVYERWKEGCNGDVPLYTTATGEITTPGWNRGSYPNDAVCGWQIQAPEGQKVEVTFVKLDLEAAAFGSTCVDYVAIYEGDFGGDLDVKFCDGPYDDNSMVTTSTGTMFSISFISNALVTKLGFKLTWRFGEGGSGGGTGGGTDGGTGGIVCGGALTGTGGTFVSPLYEEANYPNNARCEWTITVSPDKRAHVTFWDLDLEDAYSCSFDYVEIYDGDSVSAPVLGKYCGYVEKIETTGSANTLTVVFKSDVDVNAFGFYARYSEKDGSGAGEVTV